MFSNLSDVSELTKAVECLALSVPLQQEVKLNSAELNCDLFAEAASQSSVYCLRTISWNVNGTSIGPGSADCRRRIIKQMMDIYQPHLIFLQENPWGPRRTKAGQVRGNEHIFKWEPTLYDRIDCSEGSKNQNSILCRTDVLQMEKIDFPDPPPYVDREGRGFWNTMKHRAPCARIRLVEDSSMQFLCCNFHGLRHMKEINRSLLALMLCELSAASVPVLPVVVAGDFNFGIQKGEWLPTCWHLICLTETRIGSDDIDGLLFFRRFDVKQQFLARNLVSLPFEEWLEEEELLEVVKTRKLFDHVPLCCFLCLSSEAQVHFL
eukprot:Nk52_evm15s352 gene=Nk52_evmTU15s352